MCGTLARLRLRAFSVEQKLRRRRRSFHDDGDLRRVLQAQVVVLRARVRAVLVGDFGVQVAPAVRVVGGVREHGADLMLPVVALLQLLVFDQRVRRHAFFLASLPLHDAARRALAVGCRGERRGVRGALPEVKALAHFLFLVGRQVPRQLGGRDLRVGRHGHGHGVVLAVLRAPHDVARAGGRRQSEDQEGCMYEDLPEHGKLHHSGRSPNGA
mmetsp:Transcript_32107/g.90329  ORF Transcript_32107/g.90329 Transcript_32107/m.90329 type:complete len:213 (-) Transcript_32107:6-644(-)